MRRLLASLLLVLSTAACNGNARPPSDASPFDAGDDGGAADGRVAPPVLTPCPPGWADVEMALDESTCAPWSSDGPDTCAADEAHFPGDTGCARVGPACPPGMLPEDVPSTGPVLYVLAGAAGGDGTRALPFGTIEEASAVVAPGAVIAVGTGRYVEAVSVAPGVSLVGACAAETIVTSAVPTLSAGVITARGPGSIRDLSIVDSGRLGLLVEGPDEVAVAGVVVDRADGLGIASDGSHVLLEDVVVRDTKPRSLDTGFGRALGFEVGANVTLRRVALLANRDAGLFAHDATTVDAEDVVIRETAMDMRDQIAGRGVTAQFSSMVTLRRTAIESNIEVGLFAGEDATVSLEDGLVRDTEARPSDGVAGQGVHAAAATVLLRRVVVEGNREGGGVSYLPRAQLTFEDVVVRDSPGRTSTGFAGQGLNPQAGGSATLTRVLFARNREAGLLALGTGSGAQLMDVAVRDTMFRACAETSCPDSTFGIGVGAYAGATVDATRFEVSGSALCGVHIAFGGEIDLREGTISDSPIGACIQDDGYDPARLSNDVRYENNGTNLDATTLPVPDALSTL